MTQAKDNKKLPIFTYEQIIKEEGKKDKIFRVELKRPTRSLYSDADMFYSIQLNKYIKMGLLTAEQLAKRQIDVGGTFSEEQQKHYASLQTLIAEKEEMLLRLKAVAELSPDEEERKKSIYNDLALLRNQIADYEYLRNQVYEHTANSKARNDVLLWWVLNLAHCSEIKEDGPIEEPKPLFAGESHETRKIRMEELEDNEDPLALAVFQKLVKAVTLWYWIGVTDRDKLKELMTSEEEAEKAKEKEEQKPAEAVNA